MCLPALFWVSPQPPPGVHRAHRGCAAQAAECSGWGSGLGDPGQHRFPSSCQSFGTCSTQVFPGSRMKLSACCNPQPTTSFPGPSPPFPSGLVALQVLAHPSLDFPVLPWDPIPCLYIRIFLISAQSSILLLSQNIMQKVNF